MKALVSVVTGLRLEPSAFITQMLLSRLVLAASLPSRAPTDSKAILLPSGDHAGLRESANGADSLVSAARPDPSAFITQMFRTLLVLAASLPFSARVD